MFNIDLSPEVLARTDLEGGVKNTLMLNSHHKRLIQHQDEQLGHPI